jgi:hypothetical protein
VDAHKPMNHHFKRFLFRYYVLVSVTIFGGALLLFVFGTLTWQALIAFEAGVLSFAFGVQKQHLEETRLFKELFEEFNDRYDRLNEKLNAICFDPQPLEIPIRPDQRDTLFDYFNLCGEEYFYFKEGFIHPEVWRSWKSGMKFFRRKLRIKNFWDEELKTCSYYGLTFDDKDEDETNCKC